MTPTKRCVIKSKTVEEYYWGGKYACYVDHMLSRQGYESTCDRLRAGKQPLLKKDLR
jgi:hypothetical protein